MASGNRRAAIRTITALVSTEAGQSRDDAVLNQIVYLTNNDNSGISSWYWEMLDKPTGSAVSINNFTSAVADFTPDVEGTYRIKLTVNPSRVDDPGQSIVLRASGSGNTQIVLVVVRDRFGLRFPAYGEAKEANWDIDGVENTRGALPDQEQYLKFAGGTRFLIDEDEVVLSAGWGSTATVSVDSGSDTRQGQFTVTAAGSGITSPATITVPTPTPAGAAYHYGRWTVVTRNGGTDSNIYVPGQHFTVSDHAEGQSFTITVSTAPTSGQTVSFRYNRVS